jgi:hypothetical protein
VIAGPRRRRRGPARPSTTGALLSGRRLRRKSPSARLVHVASRARAWVAALDCRRIDGARVHELSPVLRVPARIGRISRAWVVVLSREATPRIAIRVLVLAIRSRLIVRRVVAVTGHLTGESCTRAHADDSSGCESRKRQQGEQQLVTHSSLSPFVGYPDRTTVLPVYQVVNAGQTPACSPSAAIHSAKSGSIKAYVSASCSMVALATSAWSAARAVLLCRSSCSSTRR